MVLTIFTWILISILFLSFGRIVQRFIGVSSISHFNVFILGFIGLSILSSVWNLFFPSNYLFLLIIFAIVFKYLKKEFHFLVKMRSMLCKRDLVFFGMFAFIAVYWSSIRSTVFDTYLYHNQIITFFSKSHLIPGLANLHGRFGFNNLTYCLSACFSFGGMLPYYQLNGLLLFWVLIYLYLNIVNQKNLFLRTINFVFVIWILRFSEEMLSSPDTVLNLLIIFFVVHKLRNGFVFNKEDLIILVFIPTIKFSAVIFSVLFFILGFLQLRKRKEFNGKLLMICSFIVLTFVGRNVLLTGQLVYPLKTPYLEIFDFRLSKEAVDNEIVGIDGWARFPGNDYANNYYKYQNLSDWFPRVIQNNFNDKYTRLPFFGEISNKVVFLFFVAGFILLLSQVFIKDRRSKDFLIPGFLFLSFLFILLKAPNARWFELYLYLAFLVVIYISKSPFRYLFVLITFILAIPYQTKRLVENNVIHSKLWAKPSLIIMPENIESVFERKAIRSVLVPSEGIKDYNTIYTKLDTIEGLYSKDRFIYRYSYKSNGLSPMTEEVSVPHKVSESIKFTGRTFVNKDLLFK